MNWSCVESTGSSQRDSAGAVSCSNILFCIATSWQGGQCSIEDHSLPTGTSDMRQVRACRPNERPRCCWTTKASIHVSIWCEDTSQSRPPRLSRHE